MIRAVFRSWWGRIGLALLLVAVLLTFLILVKSCAGGSLRPVQDRFKPAPDTSAAASETVDAATPRGIRLNDGAFLNILAGTVKDPTPFHLTRLVNAPNSLGCKGLVSAAYEIRLGDAKPIQPSRPMVIALPFDESRLPSGMDATSMAVARWESGRWRALISWVDRKKGVVWAWTDHCSTFSVVSTTRFIKQIPMAVLNPAESDGKKSQVLPRGSTIDCILYLAPSAAGQKFIKVEIPGEGIEVLDTNDFSSPDAPAVEFTIRISKTAALGLRDVYVVGDRSRHRVANAFVVGSPMVVIVDIDGMRQGIFYEELQDMYCAALRRLAGNIAPEARGLYAIECENGVALKGATTVFPPVTFAGHAAIFSGHDLRDMKMAGNEWFDRRAKPEPYKFAFTGDNMGIVGLGDSHEAYVNGTANRRLLLNSDTVYQQAHRELDLGSIVYHNMYFGDAEWMPYTWGVDEALWYLCPLTEYADRHMTSKVEDRMRQHDMCAIADMDRQSKLAIVTLYFAGLDHLGHENGFPSRVDDRQRKYLREVIDPSLAGLADAMSDATYKAATFVFTADHGQTDMGVQRGQDDADVHCFGVSRTIKTLHKFQDLLYEWGYIPSGLYNTPLMRETLQLSPARANAVIGLNGGMAHVYLRRKRGGGLTQPRVTSSLSLPPFSEIERDFDSWSEPPSFEQVLQVAENLIQWNFQGLPPPGESNDSEPGAYRKSLDLVFVRNVARDGPSAPYMSYAGPGKLLSIPDFLKQYGNRPFTQERYGWTASQADSDFLANRVAALTSEVSGDLLIIPKYPNFYCEYKPLYGDHGGFTRTDFEVPFVVLRPGPDPHEADRIKKFVEASLDLTTKNRPAVTDIRKLVINILSDREPTTGEPPRVQPPPREPSRLSMDPPKMVRHSKAPVRPPENHPNINRGLPVYAGEELDFVVTYTLPENVAGLRVAAYIDGQRYHESDGPHTFGRVRSSPLEDHTAGRHEMVFRFQAPNANAVAQYEFALVYNDRELARSQPVDVAAFPRGWVLAEILTEPRTDQDRQYFTSDRPKAGDWKSLRVEVEKGVLRAIREERVTGRQVETVAIHGIPNLLVDGGSATLTVVRSLQLELDSSQRAGSAVVPLLTVTGIAYDDRKNSTLKLAQSGNVSDQGRAYPFRIQRDSGPCDLEVTFQEKGSLMEVGRTPLRRTVILRYVRVDGR